MENTVISLVLNCRFLQEVSTPDRIMVTKVYNVCIFWSCESPNPPGLALTIKLKRKGHQMMELQSVSVFYIDESLCTQTVTFSAFSTARQQQIDICFGSTTLKYLRYWEQVFLL